jgi:hypothetical protein
MRGIRNLEFHLHCMCLTLLFNKWECRTIKPAEPPCRRGNGSPCSTQGRSSSNPTKCVSESSNRPDRRDCFHRLAVSQSALLHSIMTTPMAKAVFVYILMMVANAQTEPTAAPSPSSVVPLTFKPTQMTTDATEETIGPSSSLSPTGTMIAFTEDQGDQDNATKVDIFIPISETIGPTDPPTPEPRSPAATTAQAASECAQNPACAAQGLTGQCCPTMDDWTLTCCGGEIEESCTQNPQCNALGLNGACCPTIDDKWLDCCEVVPDECLNPTNDTSSSTSCERYSAVEYLREMQGSPTSSSRRPGSSPMDGLWLVITATCVASALIARYV